MFKFIIPLAVISAATAQPIQTRVNANFHKLVHVTLHVKAANTEKPPVLIFDSTFPKTESNQGMMHNMEAWEFNPQNLQTEGPIQVTYFDYNTRRPLECGKGIHQERGPKKLIRINVDITYSPDGVSCVAAGEYREMTKDERDDTSSKVAQVQQWD